MYVSDREVSIRKEELDLAANFSVSDLFREMEANKLKTRRRSFAAAIGEPRRRDVD